MYRFKITKIEHKSQNFKVFYAIYTARLIDIFFKSTTFTRRNINTHIHLHIHSHIFIYIK